jgi:NAD+ kinase
MAQLYLFSPNRRMILLFKTKGLTHMSPVFQRIGLMGKHRSETDITETLLALIQHLESRKLPLVIETETAKLLPKNKLPNYPRDQLGQHCDLAIVVGGDGSLLNAARAVVPYKIPILGVNRGRLGFLTDIRPNELNEKIDEILDGQFQEETRFLLGAEIQQPGQSTINDCALNDVVLMPGDLAHMIEFAIFINDQFVSSQRADGLIVATPTGSTAYALSGGGPILHPSLDAIVLVPMFPHTLSSRPIVVDGNSKIKILIGAQNEVSPRVSCDGQEHVSIAPGGSIHIHKQQTLRLIHPMNYRYFETLRDKLHWSTKLT